MQEQEIEKLERMEILSDEDSQNVSNYSKFEYNRNLYYRESQEKPEEASEKRNLKLRT